MNRLPVLLGFGFVLFLLLTLFPKSAFATHGAGYSSCTDYDYDKAETYCAPIRHTTDNDIIPNRTCTHESNHDYSCPDSGHTTTFTCRYSHVYGCSGIPQGTCEYTADNYNCYQWCNALATPANCGNYYLSNPNDLRPTCSEFLRECYLFSCQNENSSCSNSTQNCRSPVDYGGNNCSGSGRSCTALHTCVSVVAPTVTLEVKQGDDPPNTGYSGGPLTVADGSRITLRWTTGNSPDTCAASGDWNGSRVTNGGVESQTPSPGNHTYTITCTNSGGTASDMVQVAVTTAPTVDLKVNGQDGPSSSPVSVLENASVTVSWTPGNTTSCAGTVSGGFAWVGVKNSSAGTHSETASSTGGTGTRVFSITCSNASGQTISDEVYVNVSPIVGCNLTNITNVTSTSATANISTTGYDRVRWYLDGVDKGTNYGGSATFDNLSPATPYRVTATAYLDANQSITQSCGYLDFDTHGSYGYSLSCSAGPNLSVSNNPGTPTCSGCANGYDTNTANYAFLGSDVPSSNPVAGGHNISVTVNGNNAGTKNCPAPGGGGGGGGGTPPTPTPPPWSPPLSSAWITVVARFRNPDGTPYTGAGLNGASLPVYLGVVVNNKWNMDDPNDCIWDNWVRGQEINASWPPPRTPNLWLSASPFTWESSYWKYDVGGYQGFQWELKGAYFPSYDQAGAKDYFSYFVYPEFPQGFTVSKSWTNRSTKCQRDPGTTPNNFCITLTNTQGNISQQGNQCSQGDYYMVVTYTVSPPFARINGNVFIDYDGDGTKDAGVDTDYTGTTVTLSGPSSGTDPNPQQSPNFDWNNLAPGTYTLNLAMPSGYVLTTPASNPISKTLSAGETWTVPFGLSPRYTTDGSVCVDQNNNGIWDVGEPTYNNAFQITSSLGIINCPGDGLPSCPSPGAYRISNMITGTYAVTLSPITNYTFTAPATGSRSVTVGPNQTGQNFCITPMLNISGNVLRDYNHNAANDLTEDTGLGGATVTATNGVITRTTTTATTSGGGVAIGDYTITGLTPGTYTVTLTVPPGWTATYPSAPPNPKTVNLTVSTTVNFMATPYYTISGEVFIDTNKNRVKDSASENYLSTLPTPSITTTAGTLSFPSTGTYKITTLLSGTYTISYVPPLGYGMTQPSPATYIVTVGKQFTSIACSNPPVPAPGAASCYRDISTPPGTTDNLIDGSIKDLQFGITRSFTWFQGTGGSMRIDSPTGFSNYIPDDTLKTLLPGAGGTHGVIYSGVGNADFCIDAGSCLIRSSASQWVVDPFATDGQNVSQFTPFNGLIRTSYAYFDSLLKQSGVTPTLLDTPQCGAGGRTNCNLATTALPNGIYITNGDLTLSGAASYSFPADKDYIILVNGNLNISQNIAVPVGSTVLFAAKGNIVVDQSVGEVSVSSTTVNLAGFYSADGSFVLRGQNDCSLSPDRRLNVAGNITTNAALTGSGNKVEIQRDLCQGNLTNPVLTITERPDFLLNAPQFIKVNNFTSWKEVL